MKLKNNSRNRCLIVGGACLFGGLIFAVERQFAAMLLLYVVSLIFTVVSTIISDDA